MPSSVHAKTMVGDLDRGRTAAHRRRHDSEPGGANEVLLCRRAAVGGRLAVYARRGAADPIQMARAADRAGVGAAQPGVTMLLDPEDYISRELLRTGTWERPSWDAIHAHLSDGAVFVDVGAHIGYYSLKAARVVGAAGRVIAVEPNPPTSTSSKRTSARAARRSSACSPSPVRTPKRLWTCSLHRASTPGRRRSPGTTPRKAAGP